MKIIENSDFRDLSLQLYGKEVEITLHENSPSALLNKNILVRGMLTGRIWGDRLMGASLHENVIAITIKEETRESEISCSDIKSLKLA
ncbi:MAG: hypothetical protein ACJ75J_00225 [Cytophagaceae bacterium]